MNDLQEQPLIDLILLAVMMGMGISVTVITILGGFSLGILNLILVGVLCGWLFNYRRNQSNQS